MDLELTFIFFKLFLNAKSCSIWQLKHIPLGHTNVISLISVHMYLRVISWMLQSAFKMRIHSSSFNRNYSYLPFQQRSGQINSNHLTKSLLTFFSYLSYFPHYHRPLDQPTSSPVSSCQDWTSELQGVDEAFSGAV